MKKYSQNTDPTCLLRYRDSIYASDLLVCAVAHLDFFTFLSEGSKTFDEICDKKKIHPRPADVLLSLLLSMELIKKNAHRYELTELSAQYLVSGIPDSLVPYYNSLKNRPQCLEFHDVLKTGRPAGWSSKDNGNCWTKSMQNQEFADTFTAAMDSRGAFLARKLAETIDVSQHNALLDIAGGSGIYACSIKNRNSHLAAAVLEIPPVDLAAKRSIESKGMSAKVNVVTGNMFDELPTDYDVHLFANAFHDWNINSLKILADNSFESLSTGGFIAVFDAHLNQFKTGPLSVAEYSCLLTHSTEGKCYSTREIGDILMSAGFGQVEVTDVAADRTLITGKKL